MRKTVSYDVTHIYSASPHIPVSCAPVCCFHMLTAPRCRVRAAYGWRTVSDGFRWSASAGKIIVPDHAVWVVSYQTPCGDNGVFSSPWVEGLTATDTSLICCGIFPIDVCFGAESTAGNPLNFHQLCQAGWAEVIISSTDLGVPDSPVRVTRFDLFLDMFELCAGVTRCAVYPTGKYGVIYGKLIVDKWRHLI